MSKPASPAQAAALSRVLQAGGIERSAEYKIQRGLWGDTEGFVVQPRDNEEVQVEYVSASYERGDRERIEKDGVARCEALLKERGYPVERRVVPLPIPGGWQDGEVLFVGRKS